MQNIQWLSAANICFLLLWQKFCPLPPSEEEDKIRKTEKEEVETEADSDINVSRDTQSTRVILLAIDLHLELKIILHRASLKLLQLNAGLIPITD